MIVYFGRRRHLLGIPSGLCNGYVSLVHPEVKLRKELNETDVAQTIEEDATRHAGLSSHPYEPISGSSVDCRIKQLHLMSMDDL